ncbi:hypothetical protein MHU86_18991 [Fragilaria crotonensis]|nr:hypothetical protein MHU86_18991 [Fragilaria crotonensis]
MASMSKFTFPQVSHAHPRQANKHHVAVTATPTFTNARSVPSARGGGTVILPCSSAMPITSLALAYPSLSPCIPAPPPHRGSTAHFCTVSAVVINKRPTTRQSASQIPTGLSCTPHEAELDLPSLPLAARRVHIVPALRTASLLSMAQLCDAGCTVTFDAVSVIVRLHDRSILHGVRTLDTGLWHLSLVQPNPDPYVPAPPVAPPPITDCSNAAIQSATPAELVAFAHAALFSPALSTLQKAIDNGYLPNFLGLTALGLPIPASVAMIKGHLDQSRKNQRSTKLTATTIRQRPVLHRSTVQTMTRFLPVTLTMNAPITALPPCLNPRPNPLGSNRQVYCCLQLWEQLRPGRLRLRQQQHSRRTHAQPHRAPASSLRFAIHARLVAAASDRNYRLDNECSVALKTFLDAEIDYQLVPPRLHRRNAAERAIRTFKTTS